MSRPAHTLDGARLIVTVKVTPGSGRDGVAGLVDAGDGRTALAVRLAARPVEGAANRGLIDFLAGRWRLPRARFIIESGETARLKRLAIDVAGRDPGLALADLEGS